MTAVAGIDSSTQSCKVVVCDADSGEVIESRTAPHPDGTETDPRHWWAALQEAGDGLLDDVAAVSVAGQQHGMLALDEAGAVLRPALLWNDTRSGDAAAELVHDLGGPAAWADAVGLVPRASITVAKLRWLARHEPDHAAALHQVVLPHDWLTRQLATSPGEFTTDRGDASGTGYWSPRGDRYRDDLLELALGRTPRTPRVAGPAEAVAETRGGAFVAAGSGDNMAAALALGLSPGDVVVSLGTSGTVFSVAAHPCHDPSGVVAGFADATGRFLPLVCTLNAARVLSAAARMLDTDLAGLDALALQAEPGAGGLVLLPYLDGERTPDLPTAAGTLRGLTREAMTAPNLARAAVEGMLCGLADGVDGLVAQGVQVRRILLVGGAARSRAVRAVAAGLFAAPVVVPEPAEYVALGAARQAAWALRGDTGDGPPQWRGPDRVALEPSEPGRAWGDAILRSYRGHRDFVYRL